MIYEMASILDDVALIWFPETEKLYKKWGNIITRLPCMSRYEILELLPLTTVTKLYVGHENKSGANACKNTIKRMEKDSKYRGIECSFVIVYPGYHEREK